MGDPNHLLYQATGYNRSTQEVLAKIRVNKFGTGDSPRAGIAVAVGNDGRGINYLWRDEGVIGRHVEFLDDLRAWGPEFNFKWQNEAWYWMRLRHVPATATAQPDVFAKAWLADGSTAEPVQWQTWDYTPAQSTRSGFVGITAGSLGGLSEFEVDYFLVKATGLPLITVGQSKPPTNSPPVLAAIPDFSVDELHELAFTATATDPDPSANTLTFSLDPGAPSGASISAAGAFRWTPTEAQGPGTYPITVHVTDNGTPPLSDTQAFAVTVNEVNEAPLLAAIPDKNANVGSLLSFAIAATDSDLPANTLTFTLESGAPEGGSIDPASGVFTWTPTAAHAGTTNRITVRVTDNGVPPLSDTKSFTVVVAAQASAPVQLSASLLSNGDVKLVWTTTPGRTYVLQRSADLADWQDLITLNAVGESLEHIDAAAPAAAVRFYRVMHR